MQLAVGYAAIANGGNVLTPHVVRAVFAPETPDGEPGFVDLAQAEVMSETVPQARQIPMGEELAGPIIARRAPEHHRSRRQRSLDDRRGAVRHRLPGAAGDPDRRQDRVRRRASGATRGTTRRRSPPSASTRRRPYTVVSYLEKAGFGSTGAAPVVKCMYLALSGVTPLDPVAISEPLDITSDEAGRVDCRTSTRPACRAPTTIRCAPPAGTRPWRCRCCSASRTQVSATSARARPTRAATSTGC